MTTEYPHVSGSVIALGPETIMNEQATVICHKGQNYTLAPDRPALTETLDLELNLTTDAGIQIPGKFILEYPAGNGFYFVKALQQIQPEHLNPLWNELIHRQDAATIKVMLESGHAQGDDDEN